MQFTPENYYDYPAVSASGINKFIESPFKYWQASPFNPNRLPSGDDSDSILKGKIAHCLALENKAVFDSQYIVLPEGLRRDARTAAYQQFLAIAGQRTVVTYRIFEEANALAQGLLMNPMARRILQEGSREEPMLWNFQGLDCKLKTDIRHEDLIVDYKTTKEITVEGYFKAIENYGYHRAASWYLNGVEIVTGQRPRGFAHLVQNSEFPEVIGFVIVSEPQIELGESENLYQFAEIKRRMEQNDWQPFPNGFITSQPSDWYKAKNGHATL